MEHGIPTACVHRYLICGIRNIIRPSDIKKKKNCHYCKAISHYLTACYEMHKVVHHKKKQKKEMHNTRDQ